MPDVRVDEQICSACGVGVRPDTQYCYNCGESLETRNRDVACDASSVQSENGSDEAAKPVLIPNITSKDSVPESGRNRETTTTSAASQPLQSASSLRRGTRGMERKPVEVVWERAGSGSNIMLIVATILLVLFSAAVIGLALYYQ
jgi:hypothetical protein